MKINKYLVPLFVAAGLLNSVSLLDTILTDGNQSFSLFSIHTSKSINILFYALLSIVLFYAAVDQHKRMKQKN